MTDIEQKYSLFGLTEDTRTKLVQLTKLASLSTVQQRRVVVETVVVQDGNRMVIDKEERSA
ncbi:MAG: hypothetical protein J5X21_15345 [Candidatus Accumulibacter sp.]|jgi:hypothetical protein|nr:hypothetical protein [Candidatus Accumulibacter conexus]